MNIPNLFLITVEAAFCLATLQAQSGSLKPVWQVRSPHVFQQALNAEAGFSFVYQGRRVSPASASDWQVSVRTSAGGDTETTFRHPSGLAAVRTSRVFPEAEAMEYTVRFRNESDAVLPALSAVNALDLVFQGDLVEGASVVTSGGGAADPVFPPKDFALQRTYFGPMVPLDGEVALTTGEGNSSRTNLPFFFVENRNKVAGIYVSIGWTGHWAATVRARYRDNSLRLQGGMTGINVRLQPGEEITGPRILVGAYRGPLGSGANVLRRLIRERYAATLDGRRSEPPVLYTTWFDIGAELDEAMFQTLVDRAAQLGQEIFLLDASWYNGTPKTPYTDMQATWNAISRSLGNWEQGEDRVRFPSGLRVLSDYVRSKGLKFGLWFEPERVGPESLLARTHPDWILWVPNRKWGLVNLGKPEAQEYFSKILDRYIKDLDVRYIRWDQNNNLLPYWDLEPADRRGMTQIRHLEGLHKVEDFVRAHHPGVLLESCAGGGQRIDLPTLERRHTIWVSDQSIDANIVRFHLEGLNHFVPGNMQLVGFHPPAAMYQKPGFVFPDIAFQSLFGGAFGVAGRLHEWSPALLAQTRKHVDAYKKLRRFVSEDYYLLAGQARDLESWTGWQFHDPKVNEGFVQAFRIHAPETRKKLVLKGLDEKSRYEFTDVYTGTKFEAAGAKLLSEGLEFELGEETSQVLVYRRVQ